MKHAPLRISTKNSEHLNNLHSKDLLPEKYLTPSQLHMLCQGETLRGWRWEAEGKYTDKLTKNMKK